MKGKLYKPLKFHSTSEKAMKPRQRPWKDPPKIPLVYFWKSSIPDKYIQGNPRNFKHISETKRIKNTQEFLKKSQKYIEIIADSHRYTPSMRASILNSRNESFDDSDHKNKQKLSFLIPNFKEVKTDHLQIFTERAEKKDFQDREFKQDIQERLETQEIKERKWKQERKIRQERQEKVDKEDRCDMEDRQETEGKLFTAEKLNYNFSTRVLNRNKEIQTKKSRILHRRASLPKMFDDEKRASVEARCNINPKKCALIKEIELISPRVIYSLKSLGKRSSVS